MRFVAFRAVFMVAFLAALLGRTASASAAGSLEGRWRQSALREDFTIQQWMTGGCGNPPVSASTGGDEMIEVRTEGDELVFLGGGRVFRTNQCYEPMPSLVRQSHSRDASGKSWRTQCTAPPEDPRHALLNTLVVATTPEHIDLIETGRYEITLERGRCIADVKRSRAFTRVRDDAPSGTGVVPPIPSIDTAKPPACVPGEPQRLEVRPSKKLIRAGESFSFRGLVLDAKGCDTHGTASWRLAPASAGRGVSIDAVGRVTATSDATEGTFELLATAAGNDARVVVEVVSPARYDELLARSGLNAAGETDEASSVSIASESLGAGQGRVEDRSRQRRFAFLGVVGVLLLVLGAAAIVAFRRTRRARDLARKLEARHQAELEEALARKRRRADEYAAQQRAHEQSVEAARLASLRPAEGPKAGGLAQTPRPRGKICPTCGGRFDRSAEFCGKDGTVLILLN